jgi:hypothetical protein
MFSIPLDSIRDLRNVHEAPPLVALQRMCASKPALVTYFEVGAWFKGLL